MITLFKDNIKKYIKHRPFLYKIVSIPFHRIRYIYMMVTKQPYFGPILCAAQTQVIRSQVMSKLIDQELERGDSSYKVLEIGTWAGSSAVLYASACKKKGKGKVFCVDTWGGSNNTPQLRNKKKKILNLFYHNIKTSGLEDFIVPIDGSSDTVAEILKPNTFDFIFIDGDHAYTQFKKDLLNYTKVLKIGGIICGDDLEVYPSEIDILNAKRDCEEDFIVDPKSKRGFHPGIALGVNEVFGNNISMKNGFWAVRKVKDAWESVIL